MLPNSMRQFIAMKTHKGDIVIQRLDERRSAVAVDGVYSAAKRNASDASRS
jgi:hypothetical protein